MRRAAFGEPHVFCDPEQAKRGSGSSQPQSKSGRRGEVGFAGCRDFVQRAAHQSATKRLVDGGNAERQGAEAVHHTGDFLQGQKALAKLLVHL